MRAVPLPSKLFARVSAELVDNSRILGSPYGHVQREVLMGSRWTASVTWQELFDEDRLEIGRWLAQAKRGDVYTVMELLRGATPKGSGTEFLTELLTNPDFVDGTTGWSAVDAAISAGIRQIRVQNSDGTNVGRAEQTISIDTGKSFVFLAHSMAGSHDLFRMDFRDDTAGSNLVTFNTTTEGLMMAVATTANDGDHVLRLISRVATAGNYTFFTGASACRCALVKGASQTGRKLSIDGLDASQEGIVKAGEYVTIVTDLASGSGKANPQLEMKLLTADLNSDSNGEGILHFEPAIRNAPVDNAAVIFHRPRFYGYFPSNPFPMDFTPPVMASLSVTLEEDILAP